MKVMSSYLTKEIFLCNTQNHYRKLQLMKIQNSLENSPNWYIYIEPERLWQPENQRVCREMVSTINIKSYAHKVSPKWLHNCELNKDDIIQYAKVDMKPEQYNYGQLRKCGRGRGALLCPVSNNQPWKHTYK